MIPFYRVLLLSMLLSPALAAGQVFKYQDVDTGQVIVFDLDALEFNNGHGINKIFVCPEQERFHCVLGGIPFVVPRKLPACDGAWEFRGYRFVYKGEVERTVLGERLALHLIEFPGDYGTLWFLYSEDRGLLVFGTKLGGLSSTFVSTQACGFAASGQCAQ